MPVYELCYFLTQIFNIRNFFNFNSEFILANIVIASSYPVRYTYLTLPYLTLISIIK